MTARDCDRHRRGRRAGAARVGLVLLVAGAAWLAVAVPVTAHAQLESTSPADRSTLGDPPDQVRFTFNEPVAVAPGALRVYDRDGTRVDDGVQSQPGPSSAVVGLGDLADGGYVATYRVTSADGHVVRGAVTFTVGGGAALDTDTIAGLFAASGGGPSTWVIRLLAVGTMAAALVAVGALAVLGGRRSEDPATHVERTRATTVVSRAAAWGIPAAVATIPAQAVVSSGLGWRAVTNPDVLEQVLASSVGLASLTLVAGLVVARGVATTARARPDGARRQRVAAAGGGLLVVAALAMAGHTRTVEPLVVMMVGDLVHVVAAGVWLGGLVVVIAAFRDAGPDPAVRATVVARFSGRALWAIGAVVVAGAAMAWALARQPRALVSTDWGWTLVAKVSLVAVLVLVAAFNRTRLVPLVTGDSDRSQAAARRQLHTTMRVEVGLAVAILAATSLLTGLRPAAQAAGITGAFDRVVTVTDDLSLNVVVDPNRAGTNQVHLYLLDASRRPTSDVDEITVELLQTAEDLGPIVRTPAPAGPGHWILAGNELAIPGPWRITAVVATDQFTEHRVDVEVVVNPA